MTSGLRYSVLGSTVARNRGPYGRTITAEQEQLLLLLAELLEMDSVLRYQRPYSSERHLTDMGGPQALPAAAGYR